jgi:hypothetical protein
MPTFAWQWSTRQWEQYFTGNKEKLRDIPWEGDDAVSGAERQAISKSIAVFQLGESGEGRHFMKTAQVYADRSGDSAYIDALKLFIAEENRHAADLGRFMERHEIPLNSRQWSDSIFRFLRHLLNLEVEIRVLITAEIVAKVYYRALLRATDSRILIEICRQILHDEVYHVHFQAAQLARLRVGRSRLRLYLEDRAYELFFASTLGVVWLGHAPVLLAGGYTPQSFLRRCFSELGRAMRVMRPEIVVHESKELREIESIS